MELWSVLERCHLKTIVEHLGMLECEYTCSVVHCICTVGTHAVGTVVLLFLICEVPFS